MSIVAHVSKNQDLIGIAAALTSLRYNVTVWDKNIKPTYDMVAELNPELVLIDSDSLTEQSAEAFKYTRVVVFGLNFPASLKPALVVVPSSVNPALLKNVQAPTIQFSAASNYAQYSGGVFSEKYRSDVLLITTGLHETKTELLDELIKLSRIPQSVKFIGSIRINSPLYLGNINQRTYNDALVSTKICIDCDNHMLYNSLANGILCFSNTVNKYVPTYKNYEELNNLILKQDKYSKYARIAQKDILANHTYFNRLKEIGVYLNIGGLESTVDDKIGAIQKCLV